MADEIRVGDVGTIFRVTIKEGTSAVDISTATTKQIILEKPDGTNLEKDALFYTDGTDGIIQYTTVANDLSTEGIWKIQGYVVLSGGSWHSTIESFEVYGNL